MSSPRSFDERRTDALAILSSPGADAWVATASHDGRAHLVPLSFGWTGSTIVLVTEGRSLTARNLAASSRARLGFGATRDVVMVDAELVGDYLLMYAPEGLVEAFASQSGWDPRREPYVEAYRLLELGLVRLQAWRESNEIAGRTLLRDGAWLHGT
jgi:Pyridoxamine 5'-phosphate oxidase